MLTLSTVYCTGVTLSSTAPNLVDIVFECKDVNKSTTVKQIEIGLEKHVFYDAGLARKDHCIHIDEILSPMKRSAGQLSESVGIACVQR